MPRVRNRREYNREYHRTHKPTDPEKIRIIKERKNRCAINRTIRLKLSVIHKFSKGTMRCVRCGFSNVRALCIDHVNGGGTEERKLYRKTNPSSYYKRLIKEGSLEDYQTLCMNCNWIKRVENKENN